MKRKNVATSTFEEIRQASMVTNSVLQGPKMRNPQLWMPPKEVLLRVAKLITLQIDYYLTAGTHDAGLPSFLESGCLKKTDDGEVEYDFGDQVHTIVKDIMSTTTRSNKRQNEDGTPQKGKGRKKPHRMQAHLTSTPVKAKQKTRRVLLHESTQEAQDDQDQGQL